MKKIIIMLLAVSILSCIPEGEQSGQPEQTGQTEQAVREKKWERFLATFEAEKAAWEAQGIHRYRFTAKSEYHIPDTLPFTVTVLSDTELELTPAIHSYWDRYIWEWKMKYEDAIQRRPFFPFGWVTIDDFYSIKLPAYPEDNTVYAIRYNQEYHYPEEYYDATSLPGGGRYYSSLEITDFEVLEEYLAPFEVEKAAWKAQGIHSYRFTAWSSRYTPDFIYDTLPFTVTVLPDTEPEITPAIREHSRDQEIWEGIMGMEIPEMPFYPYSWITIDDYYDTVKVKPSGEIKTVINLIRYDQKYHYPEIDSSYISFSDIYFSDKPGDYSFYTFRITDFEVLEE